MEVLSFEQLCLNYEELFRSWYGQCGATSSSKGLPSGHCQKWQPQWRQHQQLRSGYYFWVGWEKTWTFALVMHTGFKRIVCLDSKKSNINLTNHLSIQLIYFYSTFYFFLEDRWKKNSCKLAGEWGIAQTGCVSSFAWVNTLWPSRPSYLIFGIHRQSLVTHCGCSDWWRVLYLLGHKEGGLLTITFGSHLVLPLIESKHETRDI
jgi:hypothetical protein